MNNATYFKQQYQLVQYSRKTLLAYCRTFSDTDFTKNNSGFGYSSVRDILVHITNSYRGWLSRALQSDFTLVEAEDASSLDDVKELFEKVDSQMLQFFDFIHQMQPEKLLLVRNEKKLQLTPMQLFSHVITHEFHHKGQILSLSRQMDYTPVDTDIVR